MSYPTEKFTLNVIKSNNKYETSTYKCSNDTFQVKMTPSQMDSIRRKLRLASCMNEIGDVFEIEISVIGKHALVFFKKQNITTIDIILDKAYESFKVGKRGKVTKL